MLEGLRFDPEDAEFIHSRKWVLSPQGYVRSGKHLVLHRHLTGAGVGQIVDHVNGDRLDNRRANLRICDRVGSNQNRRARRDSKAPFKGITRNGNKWLAQIMVQKRYYRLGLFETALQAARAYDAAAIRFHGAFARTNGLLDEAFGCSAGSASAPGNPV
jgi:hypothetical protein